MVFDYLKWNYEADDDEADTVEYPLGYFFSGDSDDEKYILTIPRASMVSAGASAFTSASCCLFISSLIIFSSAILFSSVTYEPALYCLLRRRVHSLMVREKQMSASQPLVFPFTHYIISYMALIFPPFYLENCVSFFFFSPFSPLICYAILDLVQKDSKKHIIF